MWTEEVFLYCVKDWFFQKCDFCYKVVRQKIVIRRNHTFWKVIPWPPSVTYWCIDEGNISFSLCRAKQGVHDYWDWLNLDKKFLLYLCKFRVLVIKIDGKNCWEITFDTFIQKIPKRLMQSWKYSNTIESRHFF